MKLAQELGVEIMTNSRVARIEQLGGQARGIALEDGSRIEAGAIIANVDVRRVSEDLLALSIQTADSQREVEKEKGELSCSAFVMLLGVRGEHPELAHHNTFFSADYAREFDEIFIHGRPPSDPTIYISITSRSTLADAPVGSENWFIQINAPAIGDDWDWEEQAQDYAELVLDRLAEKGVDIRGQIEYCKILTPLDLERDTGAWRGALYGASSNNRWAAFRRPHNRSRRLKGLYFAGGTTHPGGGVPMVMLSGKVASQMLIEDGN